MYPVACGSKSDQASGNLSKCCGPKIDESRVKNSKLSIITATKRLSMRNWTKKTNEMKNGTATMFPHVLSEPGTITAGSHSPPALHDSMISCQPFIEIFNFRCIKN